MFFIFPTSNHMWNINVKNSDKFWSYDNMFSFLSSLSLFQMFPANKDDNSVKRNNFMYPIVARYVRINPQRWHQFISMRIEIYGCRFGNWCYIFFACCLRSCQIFLKCTYKMWNLWSQILKIILFGIFPFLIGLIFSLNLFKYKDKFN